MSLTLLPGPQREARARLANPTAHEGMDTGTFIGSAPGSHHDAHGKMTAFLQFTVWTWAGCSQMAPGGSGCTQTPPGGSQGHAGQLASYLRVGKASTAQSYGRKDPNSRGWVNSGHYIGLGLSGPNPWTQSGQNEPWFAQASGRPLGVLVTE